MIKRTNVYFVWLFYLIMKIVFPKLLFCFLKTFNLYKKG